MSKPIFNYKKLKKCPNCGREFRSVKAKYCIDCTRKHTIQQLDEMTKNNPKQTREGKMRNKVVEILESAERIESEINFIVNTSGIGLLGTNNQKAEKLKEKLKKLVTHVQKDMCEIHNLK